MLQIMQTQKATVHKTHSAVLGTILDAVSIRKREWWFYFYTVNMNLNFTQKKRQGVMKSLISLKAFLVFGMLAIGQESLQAKLVNTMV